MSLRERNAMKRALLGVYTIRIVLVLGAIAAGLALADWLLS